MNLQPVAVTPPEYMKKIGVQNRAAKMFIYPPTPLSAASVQEIVHTLELILQM